MKYEFKINMKDLNDALEKAGAKTKDNLGKSVMAGAVTLEAHAKLNITTTFRQRTGNLRSKWETKLDHVSAQKAWAHTSPLVVYARIQELGGVIRSTSGKGLMFTTDDGVFHRVMAVTIPARPYLRPAADNNKKEIFEAMANVLKWAIINGIKY